MNLPEECIVTVPGIEALRPDLGRLYIAVGVFDGLHRGHLYLLRHLRRAARRAGARPAVITFDAHPEEIVRGVAPALLCDPGERLVRLAAAGVEVTVVQHFDAALRSTTYDRFVEMIRERVDVAGFLLTPDAAFGYERRGTPEALAELGRRDGFEVTVVPPLLLDEEPVRSSEIRRDVAEGRLRAVRRRLGRPLSVTGHIAGPGTDGRADESGVERDGGAGERPDVEFELPVALPPPGHYPVLVGPPWSPGVDPEPASRSAWATVADGRLALEPTRGDDGFEAGVGVRLVFGLGQPVREPARAAREPGS